MKDLDVYKKVVVLIDVDNVQLVKLLFILDEILVYGYVLIKWVYGDWFVDILKNWKKFFNELVIQFI